MNGKVLASKRNVGGSSWNRKKLSHCLIMCDHYSSKHSDKNIDTVYHSGNSTLLRLSHAQVYSFQDPRKMQLTDIPVQCELNRKGRCWSIIDS